MKRIIIVIVMLICAATVCFGLRRSAAAARQELATRTDAWQGQKEQLAQLQIRQQQIRQHLAETKQALVSQSALPPSDHLKQKVLSGVSWRNFSPAECEQLLADLGFNWNTTGDYIVISKKALDDISFSVLQGSKPTASAIGALALTDGEVSALGDLAKQLRDARLAWDQQHLQRTEPSGKILAQYSLPVDTDFSQSQMAVFTNDIVNILGAQRAGWFRDQSRRWQQDNGLSTGPNLFSALPVDMLPALPAGARSPQPTTLTLEGYQAGNDWQVNLTLQEADSTMTTTISPHQPVPEAFQPLFPGGWKEIAQREGFQLPKSFGKR